jgi:hypothetical protein
MPNEIDFGSKTVKNATLDSATVAVPAGAVTTGTIATARLASGTASSSTYLRGDQTWATVAGAGSTGATGATGASFGVAASNYVVQAKRSADQTITSNVDTVVQFNTSDFDPQSWLNTSTYRITPNIAGYYQVSFFAWFASASAANNQYNAQARKNGSTFLLAQELATASASNSGVSMGGTRTVYLNGTTDYLDFTVYNGTSGSITLQATNGTWATASLISYGTGATGPVGVTGVTGATGPAGSATIADGSITTAKLADPFTYDCGSYSAVAPSAPVTVSGVAGNGQVVLSWGAPVLPGGAAITDYTIQYSSNSGGSYTTFSRAASTAVTATVTGLTNSTSYIFRVAAISSAGTSAYSTASASVTPSSGAATFSTFNTAWTTIGFSGSGTAASPYTKASFTASPGADGAQATVTSTGTVRVTATTAHSDFAYTIFKNGVSAYSLADNSGGNGYDGAVNATISVTAGDVIRLGTTSDYNSYTALSIWWQ